MSRRQHMDAGSGKKENIERIHSTKKKHYLKQQHSSFII